MKTSSGGGTLVTVNQPKVGAAEYRQAMDWYLRDGQGNTAYREALAQADAPVYLHWQKLRLKSWIPNSASPEIFWTLLKLAREARSEPTPIFDDAGKNFRYVRVSHHERLLHELDLNTGGKLLGLEHIDSSEKRGFIANSLIEEAIASSQLEGAHTTRREARQIILEGREPADKHQRMIVNNHKAMQKIEETLKDQPLSVDLIRELHEILSTGGAIDNGAPGDFRKDSDNIVVGSGIDDRIAHIPPKMEFVTKELKSLISWANDERESDRIFIHPVAKAIYIHFWIGYLHPFADGNGRLARALFYWYLLRKNYWAFAFIPVSTRIKMSPQQYARAYLYAEQDDNDLTYFLDYNLRQIRLAIKDFQIYYERKKDANRQMRALSDKLYDFNERQIRLIKHLCGDKNARTNMSSYAQVNGITDATAIKDLKIMMNNGFLVRRRKGRNVFYYPTDRLFALIAED